MKDVLLLILGTFLGGVIVNLGTELLSEKIERHTEETVNKISNNHDISIRLLQQAESNQREINLLYKSVSALKVGKKIEEMRAELKHVAKETARQSLSEMTQIKLGGLCFAPREIFRCSTTWGAGHSADYFLLIKGQEKGKEACPEGYKKETAFQDYVLANVQCNA